jgi:hypothetical protein
MYVLAAQTFSRANAGHWLVRFPMIERSPVLIAQSHLAFQHFAHQPGHRGALLRRLVPSPQNGLIRDPDCHVSAHESSVARKKCTLLGEAQFSDCVVKLFAWLKVT